MRICFDLDGVISSIRGDGEGYENVQPLPGAVETMQQLKAEGHYIIIHTARRMKTHNACVGRVVADIGHQTLNWLQQHEIPYDEIYFGKPHAHIYIDDNAFRFENWNQLNRDLTATVSQYSGPAK